MASTSLKLRLIDALETRIDQLESRIDHGDAPASIAELVSGYRDDLRRLRQRGSGPLPPWARLLAGELGVDVNPRTAAASTT